jgi:hypothetical protein
LWKNSLFGRIFLDYLQNMRHFANNILTDKKEKKEMRKKLILGTTLTLSLALIVAVVAVIPTIANAKPSNSIIKYATLGQAPLQLPPPGGAIASHPTNLKLIAFDYSKQSYVPLADAVQVLVWVSALNTYVPIAFISDKPWTAQDKAILNNTAMYLEVNGVIIRNNLKVVADKELDVWTEKSSQHGTGDWGWDEYGRYVLNTGSDNILMVNLTVPVQLDFTGLPPVFGSAFALPAMHMTFVGIAEGSLDQSTSTLPSGATISEKVTVVPAWAEVDIPTWGIAQFIAAGIGKNVVLTFTLPP